MAQDDDFIGMLLGWVMSLFGWIIGGVISVAMWLIKVIFSGIAGSFKNA